MHARPIWAIFDGDSVGPFATIIREPGQAWKGAAVAETLCAEVWLAGSPPILHLLRISLFLILKPISKHAFFRLLR